MNDPIPIPNVSSKIMSKIVAYCKRHSEHDEAKKAAEGGGAGASGAGGATASSAAAAPAAVSDDDLKDFDAEFVKVDQSTLFEMILAANYLDVKVREIKEGFFVFFVSDFFLLFSSSSLYRLLTSGGEKTKKRNKNLPKPLLNLTCLTVANMIKGKTPEEIRKTFNIPNDFTPEEEEEVRRENQWAFGAFFSCVLSCSFFLHLFSLFLSTSCRSFSLSKLTLFSAVLSANPSHPQNESHRRRRREGQGQRGEPEKRVWSKRVEETFPCSPRLL